MTPPGGRIMLQPSGQKVTSGYTYFLGCPPHHTQSKNLRLHFQKWKSLFSFSSPIFPCVFFAKKGEKDVQKGSFLQIDFSIHDLSNGTRLEHV